MLMLRVHCIYSAGALRLFCGGCLCKVFAVYKARVCSIASTCPSYGGGEGGQSKTEGTSQKTQRPQSENKSENSLAAAVKQRPHL